LVGAPDADILAAGIEILPKRITAETATFLVKVKAYRGEPVNEKADILADKAMSDPRQRVVPTDESSSLHVEKIALQNRENNLSRLSFDIE